MRELEALVAEYRWFHANAELSFQEHETAARIAGLLDEAGFEVHTGVGGTGVIGVLRNGDGPVIALRADIDGLPIEERTGRDYASRRRQRDPEGNEVAVMHACGHDIHITSLLGASRSLAASRDGWSGTLEVIFQPAEEVGGGAAAIVDSGIFDEIPVPGIVLGQHVGNGPTDLIRIKPGALEASADSWKVVFRGKGGHGAGPHRSDDIALAIANAVTLLQNVVSRQLPAVRPAVITVSQIHVGTKDNILAEHGWFTLNIRSFEPDTRTPAFEKARRLIEGVAAANGLAQSPEFISLNHLPPLVNDEREARVVEGLFREHLTGYRVEAPDPILGSEDFGVFGERLGVPSVYWFVGGTDPEHYRELERRGVLEQELGAGHSPYFAPDPLLALPVGVKALVVAAHHYLDRQRPLGAPSPAEDTD